MRTTIDLEKPILKAVKRLAKERGMSIGRLVSQLLAQSLEQTPQKPARFDWDPVDMGVARVDLGDKDRLNALLDERK